MSLENVLSKNPSINDASHLAARKQDGVDKLYFDSDHSDSPVSGENGRYHEVDGKDRITVKGIEGEETVTAEKFVSDDKFSSFGSPQERLNLLSKASKYEIPRGQELKTAEDLKDYVNSLKPKTQKTPKEGPSWQEIAQKVTDLKKDNEVNLESAVKKESIASSEAKLDNLQSLSQDKVAAKSSKKDLEEDFKMNKKFAEDNLKKACEMMMKNRECMRETAFQNFTKSPSLETLKKWAFTL